MGMASVMVSETCTQRTIPRGNWPAMGACFPMKFFGFLDCQGVFLVHSWIKNYGIKKTQSGRFQSLSGHGHRTRGMDTHPRHTPPSIACSLNFV